MNAVTETKAAKAQEAPKHKGLYDALAAAQAEMGKALKDSSNPHFKSKYADLASVMDACMPALSRHGIAVLQPAFDDDSGRYVKTIFVHGETGESTECRVPLIVAKNDMQGYGSAVTYARRYGLMGMAGIAPDDDDGNAAAAAPPREEPRQQGPGKEAIDAATFSLESAETLDALKAIWTDLPKAVQAVPAVIKAKDAAKARIEAPADQPQHDNADLGGDSIPY
jgi:hypothetical protein